VEVSIIGPGRGECIIVHLGNNEWFLVDSCIAARETQSVVFEYLDSFKNNAIDGIRWILATHWHDDHIRGLAELLARVPKAEFFCSSALNSDEFFMLTQTANASLQSGSGVEEFGRILGLIESAAPNKREKRTTSPKWVIENRVLALRPAAGRPFAAKVTALSPSDGTVKLAMSEIAKLIPKPGSPQSRITRRSANHSSVVLWVEVGPLRFLLGADLERTAAAGQGWTAVLQCHQGLHDAERAGLIKIPHHGSENGDEPEVWNQMLHANPIAVITPYNTGRVKLPQETDLDRLSKRTDVLYCTAEGAGKEPPRDAAVSRAMRQQLTSRRVIDGRAGHVRIRWSSLIPGEPPKIEAFNGAFKVKP
jgi:beta-lactamase superfamily II metal-dependent hydrolase